MPTLPPDSPFALNVRDPLQNNSISVHRSFVADEKSLNDMLSALEAGRLSPNTRRAYRADLTRFGEWCRLIGRTPLPATEETVRLYIAEMASTVQDADGKILREPMRPSTIDRAIAAISAAHVAAKTPSPCRSDSVRQALAAVKATLRMPSKQKSELVTAEVARMLAAIDVESPTALRDYAMVAVGYNGAFRRSELVDLRLKHLTQTPDGGFSVLLERSKTDQTGKGRTVRLDYRPESSVDPVAPLTSWLKLLHEEGHAHEDDFVFVQVRRDGKPVRHKPLTAGYFAAIVKKLAARAGLDPAKVAGHSLRSGFVTQMRLSGVEASEIMQQTGHRSLSTLARYDRRVQGRNVGATHGLDGRKK